PFVALSALALALLCWHEARGRAGVVALLGLLLGISPWLIYLVTTPSPDAARSFLQQPVQSSRPASPTLTATKPQLQTLSTTLIKQALGVVLISVPNITGATTLCTVTVTEAWPPEHWTTPHVRTCMVLRTVWGTGFLALLGLALTLELRALRRLSRRGSATW